jgi:hypothetical protein
MNPRQGTSTWQRGKARRQFIEDNALDVKNLDI